MSTYSTYIDKLRNKVGDKKRRIHVDWTGDGTTNVFQMPADTYPVLDDTSTYVVKVASVIKTETTDYTLDKSTGTLTLVSTPTNGQAVTIDSIAVYLRDADWLQVINDTILSLGDDFWKEFVDETGITTTANMLSVSLTSAQPNCIAVYEFSYRASSTENWSPVENYTNWRYDRENNKLYLGDREAFTVASQPLKVRGLKKYTLGTLIADTIDVQDRYMTVIDFGCEERYWQYRYKDVVELISKQLTENTRTPLQELIMLSDRARRLYEAERAKLKPQKPARLIPSAIPDGGRP